MTATCTTTTRRTPLAVAVGIVRDLGYHAGLNWQHEPASDVCRVAAGAVLSRFTGADKLDLQDVWTDGYAVGRNDC